MAENPADKEIAALGRVCGIAPEYCDNSGGRHPTSLATITALLSAMGVPWQDPKSRRQELALRLLGPWRRFLEPTVILTTASPKKVSCYFLTPTPEVTSPLRLQAVLDTESGPNLPWEEEIAVSSIVATRPVPGGFRHRLDLCLPPELPLGYHNLQLRVEAGNLAESGWTRLIVVPERTYLPECLDAGRRRWGFNLPLYALKSRHNWGIGDFGDLMAVIKWAASLGAAFVGVNPLHAPPPLPDADPSPYAPASRLFLNFLYLDLEKTPEMLHCPEAQALVASPEFQILRARLRERQLIPYSEVFHLKRRVLGLFFRAFRDLHGPPETPCTSRGAEFAAFLQSQGECFQNFGLFCALTEHFQIGDWRRWPEEYQRPRSEAVASFNRQHKPEIQLYLYAQWLAAVQLREAEAAARRSGLPFSLYQDLALGAAAGGFDTWANPDQFARDVTIGAPPDAFTPKGQNWGIPPIIPAALRESGYHLFIDTIRASAPEDGMLRLDHVMGLFRLLWIPAGMAPAQGAYVHYPARELLAILALESQRRRSLVIGEDLGTVSPRVRRDLGRLGVFSYRVFYFERDSQGRYLPPEKYPAQSVATVTTHDLPTLEGFWQGRDLAIKRQTELYPDPHVAEKEVAQRQQDRLRLVEAVTNRGLLPEHFILTADSSKSCPSQVREGVLEYLAQSEASLLEVRLEEVFGFTNQQNFPGTSALEHPNWRRRLPLTLEEMTRDPEPGRLAQCLNQFRGHKP